MCCFAQPVLSVSDTNLFARLSGSGKQFLVYQMKFESEEANAMILPLPVATPAEENSVEFISLEKYENFFDDLNKGFPEITPRSLSRSQDAAGAVNSAKKLEVHHVGDFVASFVPTIDDFSRLDKQFVIPKESWDKIPQYSDYGFAVFQLKERKGKPHAMAFEFKSRWPNKIFFPTVHIHDGQVHKREQFDHALYCQNEKFDEVVDDYVNRHVKDKKTGFVRSKRLAKEFCNIEKTQEIVEPELLVHRIEMKGRFDNTDVVVDFSKEFSLGSQSLPKIARYWPIVPAALLSVVGVGWFFNRRDKIRNESTEPDKT